MKLNLSKWKKVKEHKDHTVFKNDQGHELKVAHKGLSSKMREQLSSLPGAMAEGGEVEPIKDNKPPPLESKKPNSFVDDFTANKPVKMAEGGKIADPDPKKAAAFVKGFQDSKPGNFMENLKHAFEPVKQPTPTPKAKSYAEGGDVVPMDPQSPAAGTADAAPAPTTQAPITINVGAQPNSTPMPPLNAAQQGYNDIVQGTPHAQLGIGGGTGQTFSGGEAPQTIDPEAAAQVQANQMIPQEQSAALTPQAAPQAMPEAAQPQAVPQAKAPAGDLYGIQTTADAFNKGMGEEKAGIFGEAAAKGALGKAEGAVLDQGVAARQQMLLDHQEQVKQYKQETDHITREIREGLIDPKTYFSNMGTMDKISAVVGMILGGLSGHDPRQVLNARIRDDIATQKAAMDQKNNLLHFATEKTKNLQDGIQLATSMQQAIVADQLKMAAAKAATPMAKAMALQTAGKLDRESADIQGSLSMKKALLGGMGNGAVSPEHIVNMLVPKEQKAEATKELREAQNTVSMKDNIINAFEQLSKLNTVGNRAVHAGFTPPQVKAIRDPLIASLSKDTAGKFTEQDAKMLGALFPSPGDSAETIMVKRNQLNKLVSEKMHFPTLKHYGIDVNNMGRYNKSGVNRITESAPVTKVKN